MNEQTKLSDLHRRATPEDVRHVMGEIDDVIVARILSTAPSYRDLSDAALYVRGDGDLIAREQRELSAGALAVAEILAESEEALPEDEAS